MDEEVSVLRRVGYVITGLGIAVLIHGAAWSSIAHDNQSHYGALASYSRAIRLKPKDGTDFYNQGKIYDELGYYDRALADYSEAIWLNREDAATFCKRARLFALLGEPDKALSELRQAFELDEANDSTPVTGLHVSSPTRV
jgi:tetratricopeptide (TPR) repeat protein